MHLEGTVPATEAGYSLMVSSRGNRYVLDDENSEATSLEAIDEGIYVLWIAEKEKNWRFELYALPATIKLKSPAQSGSVHATFTARLTTLRPSRYDVESPVYDDFVSRIKMACTYDYEI